MYGFRCSFCGGVVCKAIMGSHDGRRKIAVTVTVQVSGLHPSSKMPIMNNIHCLQVTGGESEPRRKYYYMVSINYPCLVKSEEAASARVEATKNSPGRNVSGHFTLRHVKQPYYFYLYEFDESIPARNAKVSDFAVQRKKMETDTILPPSGTIWFSIDFRIISITSAEEAAEKIAKEALTMFTEYVSGNLDVSQFVAQVRQLPHREHEHRHEYELDLQSSSIALPEIARNELVFSQISEVAHIRKDIVSFQTRVQGRSRRCGWSGFNLTTFG